MSTTDAGAPAPPSHVRIGLWGPPNSGKTTYLAALNVATLRADLPENWIMSGANDEASDFLNDSTHLLTSERRFPEGTKDESPLAFRFIGEETVTVKGTWGRTRQETVRQMFHLDMLDVPGRVFGARPSPAARSRFGADAADDEDDDFRIGGAETPAGPPPSVSAVDPAVEQALLDHLQSCDGIIYLFDPVRDAREGDSFEYFQRILEKLTRRVFDQSNFGGTRLPHRVAVCVTKFDDPLIYEVASRGGFLEPDETPPHLPRVRELAQDFFTRLCELSPGHNADLVAGGLRKYFHHDRLGYFVTSAVGFHVAANGWFRHDDFVNVVRGDDGFRIRGRIHPIDILEPLLWLQKNARPGGPR